MRWVLILWCSCRVIYDRVWYHVSGIKICSVLVEFPYRWVSTGNWQYFVWNQKENFYYYDILKCHSLKLPCWKICYIISWTWNVSEFQLQLNNSEPIRIVMKLHSIWKCHGVWVKLTWNQSAVKNTFIKIVHINTFNKWIYNELVWVCRGHHRGSP